MFICSKVTKKTIIQYLELWFFIAQMETASFCFSHCEEERRGNLIQKI